MDATKIESQVRFVRERLERLAVTKFETILLPISDETSPIKIQSRKCPKESITANEQNQYTDFTSFTTTPNIAFATLAGRTKTNRFRFAFLAK